MLIEFSTAATAASPLPGGERSSEARVRGHRFVRIRRNPSPAALTRVDLSLKER